MIMATRPKLLSYIWDRLTRIKIHPKHPLTRPG